MFVEWSVMFVECSQMFANARSMFLNVLRMLLNSRKMLKMFVNILKTFRDGKHNFCKFCSVALWQNRYKVGLEVFGKMILEENSSVAKSL